MGKAILIIVVIIISCGAIVRAEPLPLVPGQTTEQTTVQTKAQTEKETEAATVKSEATTAKTEEKTTEERIIEDTEEQSAMAAQESLSLSDRLEKGHWDWFVLESKEQGELEALAVSVTDQGDYRSKAHRAALLWRGLAKAVQSGQAAADDFRAASLAMLGFNYWR